MWSRFPSSVVTRAVARTTRSRWTGRNAATTPTSRRRTLANRYSRRPIRPLRPGADDDVLSVQGDLVVAHQLRDDIRDLARLHDRARVLLGRELAPQLRGGPAG